MRRQFADDLITDALDGDPSWWDRAPKAGARASIIAEKACAAAYLAGGSQRARMAIDRAVADLADHRTGVPTEYDARPLMEDAAGAASLTPEIVLGLVAEVCKLPPNAERLAEMAVNEADYQWILPDDEIVAIRAAEHGAPFVFGGLPEDACAEDFARAILAATPALTAERAKDVADRSLFDLAAHGNLRAAGMKESSRLAVHRAFIVSTEPIVRNGRATEVTLRMARASERAVERAGAIVAMTDNLLDDDAARSAAMEDMLEC